MESRIRWRRVCIATLVLCGICLAPFAARFASDWKHDREEQRAAVLHPHAASDAEQSGILRAVLKDRFWLWARGVDRVPDNPVAVVLLDTAVTFCGEDRQEVPAHPPLADHGRGRWRHCVTSQDTEWTNGFAQDEKIDGRLLRELAAANQVPAILPDPHLVRVVYTSQATTASLLANTGWDPFQKRFPHSTGAIKVSRAVLSRDGTHALIYVQILMMGFPPAEQDVLYDLVRTRDGWQVEKSSGPATA